MINNAKIGIYKIISPSGKIYIGQSQNINNRIKDYKSLRNCKLQTRLYNSFIKYGVENHIFEIVEECSSENLNNRERYFQEFFKVLERNKGLNCYYTRTESKSGKLSLETRLKISKSNEGRIMSPETRKKIGDAQRGEKSHMWGKKHSKELIEKMSKIKLGKKFSKETRKKIGDSKRGDKNWVYKIARKDHPSAKQILDTKTNKIYDSILDASEAIGMNYKTLANQLSGHRKNKTTLIYK